MATLMKGKTWAARKHKVTYPCAVEPKVDEIRCEVTVALDGTVSFMSYAGKPLHNLAEFAPMFLRIANAEGVFNFDCGVEVNNNFNDSYRWVRSSRGAPPDLAGAPVVFHLFDLPELCAEYEQRARRCSLIASCHANRNFTYTHPEFCSSEDEVEAEYVRLRDLGYEGAMVKRLNGVYAKGKRTDDWLKMKPEEDADGRIVSITQAYSEDGEALGRAGSVTLVLEDGSTASPAGIAWELGKAMWENPDAYIGTWWEFRFMERDRAGGYRHPVLVREREAKA